MIRCEEFCGWLAGGGVDFFTGVPDSLLADLCAYLADHAGARHVVAANEGGSVALACGHYLAEEQPEETAAALAGFFGAGR